MSSGILAVDLGLRCGLAFFEADGTLAWFRSHHFANVAALKRAVYGLVRDANPSLVVVEGDSRLAAIWEKSALKLGASLVHPSPERWRRDVLLPREQRSSAVAKASAHTLAETLIAERAANGATELRTDTAEAICLGWWAFKELPTVSE